MEEKYADAEIAMNPNDLYQEETFTDRRIGSIQKLTPIGPDGSADPARPVLFIGQTQVMTPAGALPLQFEIPAASLEEAISQFGDEAKLALEQTMKKLEELRREAASSLIVPGSEPGGIPGGGVAGGGIQLK